jgi:hypothetical protein
MSIRSDKQSIVKVGDGRGFVIEGVHDRFVITAAHCLPHLPPCILSPYLEEKTYGDLLGPIDGAPTVWAECLFADPVNDIAILGTPDNQALYDQAESYEEFTEAVTPIRIREATMGETAWKLDLDGMFKSFLVEGVNEHFLWLKTPAEDFFKGGESGSPLLGDDGRAVSLCQIGSNTSTMPVINLPACLPRWFDAQQNRRRKKGGEK